MTIFLYDFGIHDVLTAMYYDNAVTHSQYCAVCVFTVNLNAQVMISRRTDCLLMVSF